MNSHSCSLILLLLVVALATNYYFVRCEKLSTVFVLETSDSDTAVGGNNDSAASSTIVIDQPLASEKCSKKSDASSDSSTSCSDAPPPTTTTTTTTTTATSVGSKQKKSLANSPVVVIHHSGSSNHKHLNGDADLDQHHTGTHQSNQEARESERRVEDELTLATNARHRVSTSTRSTTSFNEPPARAHRPKVSTTTTTTSGYDSDQVTTTTPRTEERLLISITNNNNDDDDDDNQYKPPQKQVVSASNGGTIQLGQIHSSGPHKRKPASITISIQDTNLGKLDGGSVSSAGESPALILRPSENGQSIVISTGGNSNANTNNKPNSIHQKPPGHNSNLPIEIPVHHTAPSSTRRPAVGVANDNGYSAPANRPISSSLIEQARPPVSLGGDERPQRPVSLGESTGDSIYESQLRPTPRPPHPVRPSSQELGEEGSAPAASESRYPVNERNCGLVHETRIVGGEEANPDDFLWMAAIIKSRPTDGEARPFCGGSLITRRHILTAAHCLENLAPRDVLVRLGSYDFDDATASSLSADYAIDQFRVPAQYSKKTHVADLAIMRLKTPLSASDNYKTVCMPQPRRSYVGALATVTGYGSQSQTFRRAAPKLRQVTVPIWENRKCSAVYKKNLTEAYLCAGYEEGGKDACQGDSGGPLMTEGPNERMMVVGVVSHGIGCGSPGYPGVYTRTTTYLDWIEKNTRE